MSDGQRPDWSDGKRWGRGEEPVSASASDVKTQGSITTQRKRVRRRIKEHVGRLGGTNANKYTTSGSLTALG